MSANYHADRLLPSELQRYKVLRERLLSEVPGIDDETLADTLEGISDLREMLAEAIRSALDDEAIATGLATRLQDMKVRLDRLTTRAIRKRSLALNIMIEAELSKLLFPDFTASLRKGALVLEIISEASIPPEYWKPQPAKLDRQALISNLKSGNTIEGAVLTPAPPQLAIRTK